MFEILIPIRAISRRTLLSLLALSTFLVTAGTVLAAPNVVRLATTTSTENSGLLNLLLPRFEAKFGQEVQVIAVGTGKALRMGQSGDADVILVHAREAELEYMAAGYGIDRRDVMYNQFVLVGPDSDPLAIKQAELVTHALKRVQRNAYKFVSRGDDSGTHKKELMLWNSIPVVPQGEWYLETGQGMARTLFVANELDAYALTDKATWLALRDKLDRLDIVFDKGARLHNPYGIIATNPDRYPDANYIGAKNLIDWITSDEAKGLIDGFEINGEQLFYSLP